MANTPITAVDVLTTARETQETQEQFNQDMFLEIKNVADILNQILGE